MAAGFSLLLLTDVCYGWEPSFYTGFYLFHFFFYICSPVYWFTFSANIGGWKRVKMSEGVSEWRGWQIGCEGKGKHGIYWEEWMGDASKQASKWKVSLDLSTHLLSVFFFMQASRQRQASKQAHVSRTHIYYTRIHTYPACSLSLPFCLFPMFSYTSNLAPVFRPFGVLYIYTCACM